MRVLFITSNRIGDAVLSSGLLAHLIERFPQARFTIAAGPAAAPLFEAVPRLERLIPMEKRRYAGHWLRLWGACFARQWHLVVDLRRSGLPYTLIAHARRRMAPDETGLHKVRQYARVLDLEADPPAPRVWSGPPHERRARELIPDGPPVLALGPTANWAGKEWRAERFAAVAKRLTAAKGAMAGARVAVFAGPDERDRALPVLEAVPARRRIDLAGKLDLLTAHACIARCGLYIGNDSGLMHIAAASGAPTLGLFGPSLEQHYGPWGPNAAHVRTAQSFEEIVGVPDYDHRTTGTLMDSLSVEVVETAARDLLKRVGAKAA